MIDHRTIGTFRNCDTMQYKKARIQYTYKLKLNAPSINPIPLQKDVQIEASIFSNTVLYGVLQRLRTQDILLAEAVQILGWAPHSFPFGTFHSFPFF